MNKPLTLARIRAGGGLLTKQCPWCRRPVLGTQGVRTFDTYAHRGECSEQFVAAMREARERIIAHREATVRGVLPL